MVQIRVCEDIEECQQIWQKAWPQECLFDLWQVRSAFHRNFNNSPYFLVAEKGTEINGLLALSWLEQEKCYAHFPGETWQGKTWLEQNRILAEDAGVFNEMLAEVPGRVHLRYLTKASFPEQLFTVAVDETGYLFHPPGVDYSFANYQASIPTKSRKKLCKDFARFEGSGVSFRHDHLFDIDLLFKMNLDAFGDASYFSDPRFLRSFEELIAFLAQAGMLRVTTVLIGGIPAAIDISAVLNHRCTVLAGGTNPEFPGIAKFINFHHLEWACQSRMESVDFLCGDFGWKERFRLTPRPLFELRQNNTNNIDYRSRNVAL